MKTATRRAIGEYMLRHQGDVYIWLTAHAVFAEGSTAADIRKAHDQIIDHAQSMTAEDSPTDTEALHHARQACEAALRHMQVTVCGNDKKVRDQLKQVVQGGK